MAWLDELGDIIIEQLNQLSWKEVSEALDTFYPEFAEPTPYVGCYQSLIERSLIWASALRQFYRR